MIEAAPEAWVARWFEYHRLASGTRDQRKALSLGQPPDVQAARDWVEERIMVGGLEAVDVVTELSQAASTEDEQSLVGIGPVEDLISTHGDEAVAALLERARRLPRLAEALSWIWLPSGSVSTELLARLAEYQRAH